MNASEVTLYRCYWPAAYRYLRAQGVTDFFSRAYDLLMTLEVAHEHAYAIAAKLPAGAIIDVVPLEPVPLHPQEIDELLFAPKPTRLVSSDKN